MYVFLPVCTIQVSLVTIAYSQKMKAVYATSHEKLGIIKVDVNINIGGVNVVADLLKIRLQVLQPHKLFLDLSLVQFYNQGPRTLIIFNFCQNIYCEKLLKLCPLKNNFILIKTEGICYFSGQVKMSLQLSYVKEL